MTTVFIPEGAKGAQIVFKAKYGFSSLYPTCEMSVLTEFEATLPGGTLPTSYRDFLLQWNGGRFSSQVNVGFPLRDSDDVSDCGRVFHFYGLFNFTHNFDLRQASQRYGFRKAVPTEYIAIGDDYHWDQLCISVYGNDVGFIYWWQPGEPWPEETEPTTQSLRPVAESFEKFWDLLFEIDEAE